MGYFPVRYDSRVVIYDRRGFIRLATATSVNQALGTCSGVIEASLTSRTERVSEIDPNPPIRYDPEVLRLAVTSSCPVLRLVVIIW